MNSHSYKHPPVTGTKVLRKVACPSLLALGAAVVALTPIATRADDFSAHSQRLSFAKLDLNSVKGARKAYARIKAAAWSVCGESSWDIEVMIRGPSECVQGAIARAVRDVRSAELSKLYIKRNGIELATLYGVRSPIVTAENSK